MADAAQPRSLADEISPGLRTLITITVMAATLMEVLDTSITNVALPHIMGNLGATLDEAGWISTGYIIANVIVLPLSGFLTSYFGRRNYLGFSVILFTIASLGCGLSSSLPILVFWRILQGAGGAAFLATAQATLIEIYPKRLQAMAQAIFGIGVIMAPTVGPTLGGWLTDTYSWPMIFLINIPIGIITAILTFANIPDSRQGGIRRKPDLVGILFLALGLGSLQYVLERGEREDWFASPLIVNLTFLSLTASSLFIWWMLSPRNAQPAVNLRVLKNANLSAGSAFSFAMGFILYGVVFIVPQFLQNAQAHTAMQAGMILFPGGLASALMMPVVGRLAGKFDSRLFILLGMGIVGLGMFLFMGAMTLSSPDSVFFWPLVCRGAGIGLVWVPLSLIALGTLKGQEISEGAGIFNLFRQLGGSFGIAILATLLTQRQQFHYARLTENTGQESLLTAERLSMIQHGMMARGMGSVEAAAGAQGALVHTMVSQASVLAFKDLFFTLGIVASGTILLVAIFKKPTRRAAPVAAH